MKAEYNHDGSFMSDSWVSCEAADPGNRHAMNKRKHIVL